MRIPISLRLIIYFLSISILSIYILGTFSFNKSREALINRTFEQLISVRVEKETRFSHFIKQRKQDLKNITNHKDAKTILQETKHPRNKEKGLFENYISDYLQANLYFKRIIFIDPLSNFRAYQLENGKYLETNTEVNLQLVQKIEPSEIYFREIKKERQSFALMMGTQVFDDNHFMGYILLEINYEPINQIMSENNQYNGLGNSGEVYLVGSDFLMRSSSRFKDNSVFNTKVETLGVTEAFRGIQGQKTIKDYRGINVLSSYKKLKEPGLNWVILAEIDYEEAMITVKSVENNIMYLSIVISLFLLGTIAAVSANITSPIRKLQHAVEDISKGEYGKPIHFKAKNEIGDLIKGFNDMTLALKDQSERLEYQQLIRTTAVINGQEQERQRLSREIHDGLAQYILAIKLKLENAFDKKGKEKEALLQETKELFSQTIKEIRNISNNLMPSVLSEFGLVTAIENLAKTINTDTALHFEFSNLIENEILNEKLNIYIYRIIQEALNNTIKHANATNFEVKLSEKQNQIKLTIIDDGVGFDKNNKSCSGNGILNMKERVNLLSGQFAIEADKGNGVKIKISIPL